MSIQDSPDNNLFSIKTWSIIIGLTDLLWGVKVSKSSSYQTLVSWIWFLVPVNTSFPFFFLVVFQSFCLNKKLLLRVRPWALMERVHIFTLNVELLHLADSPWGLGLLIQIHNQSKSIILVCMFDSHINSATCIIKVISVTLHNCIEKGNLCSLVRRHKHKKLLFSL